MHTILTLVHTILTLVHAFLTLVHAFLTLVHAFLTRRELFECSPSRGCIRGYPSLTFTRCMRGHPSPLCTQVSRARTSLQKREVPLLLYTERAHFFRRHNLRGARHLAVYSPPSHAHFYTEMQQQLGRGGTGGPAGAVAASSAPADSSCVTLFCRLDAYPLQRIVGSDRAARMIHGQESSFLFG